MTLHHMNKDDRMRIAMRSEEIFDIAPFLTLEKVGVRLDITAQHLSNIRKEFGFRSIKEMKGRK